jgi:hypothetical protein
MKRSRAKRPAWRRRSGVVWRPGQLGVPREPRYGWFWQGVWQNDGGEDAPLSERGRWIYHWIIGGIVFVGVALLLLFR